MPGTPRRSFVRFRDPAPSRSHWPGRHRFAALAAGSVLGVLPASGGARDLGDPMFAARAVHAPLDGDTRPNHLLVRPDGRFAVVWESTHGRRGSDTDIYIRVFEPNGRPLTGEVRVNEHTSGHQRHPFAAMNDAGEFVVSWTGDNGQDGSAEGAYARSFDARGRPRGGEVAVATQTLNTQEPTGIAIRQDGSFVVTWHQGDGSSRGIAARVFDADGGARSGVLEVNQSLAHEQAQRDFAMDADGRFAVVWTRRPEGGRYDGAWLRVYDADGTPLSDEVVATATTTGFQELPQIGGFAGGRLVIGWQGEDGSREEQFVRVFDGRGVPLSGDIALNAWTTGQQLGLQMAMDATGSFVAAWQSQGQDGRGFGAYARAFDADGAPRSPALRVSPDTAAREPAHVAINADGSFVVVYHRIGGSSNRNLRARVFGADGTPVSDEILVSGEPQTTSLPVRFAQDGDGNFAIAWQTHVTAGSAYQVRARAFRRDGTPASGEIVVNDSTDFADSPHLGFDRDGDFVVAWRSNRDYVYSTWVRRFTGFAPVDLALELVDSADPVEPEQPFEYVLRVVNGHATRPDPAIGLADGVAIVMPRPAGAAFDGHSSAGWDCVLRAQARCRLRGALPAGAASELRIGLTAPPRLGDFSSSATVSGLQADPRTDNDSDTETTRLAADLTPEPFAFRGRNGIQPGVAVRTGSATLAALGERAPVTIAGDPSARWSLNGGPFQAEPGHIGNGDTLRLQLSAGPLAGAAHERRMSVTVGTYTTTFVVRTIRDERPTAFDFADRTTRAPGGPVPSASVEMNGFTMPLRASVTGDATCRLRIDAGDWMRRTLVGPGQALQLRVVAAPEPGGQRGCSVTLGDAADSWTVSTVE